MLRNEAMEEYGKAQKLGQKDYREKMLHGQSPFLPVLDEILQNVQNAQRPIEDTAVLISAPGHGGVKDLPYPAKERVGKKQK